ncbi:MAG TPA: HD domain-containing protein, partial [Spirochaetia bacterium]|nr:HD domain-containing protein [Spirochaetia bacterium]
LAEKGVSRRAKEEEGVLEGAVALGRKYSFDEGHALHVARLAGQLFDQLVSLHKLGSRDRRILIAAAILHDIGEYVSLKGHHKHTLYLISRSELTGFTAAEQFLVANVARYHRKGAPSLQHPEFALLSAADRSRVRRMASLLRIADALDKEHREKLSRIAVRQRDGRVEILAGRGGELLLEKWALEKKADLFRRTFGAPVFLIPQEPDSDG